ASPGKSVRLWDLETGRCLRVFEGHTGFVMAVAWSGDQRSALSIDNRSILVWDLSEFVAKPLASEENATNLPLALNQVQYTNAKVLVVGDTSAGKTGLAHRLATGSWKPSDGSTVGAWSTQWSLPEVKTTKGLEQEIWLWDFGGQADQR